MDKHLKKIEYFPRKDMLKIAAKYFSIFYRRVFERGLDKDGKQFPPYSESYRKLLEKDFRDKDGRILQAYKGLSLETGAGKIARRNPRLTGRTARDLKVIERMVRKDQIAIGWESDAAGVVEDLENKGRDFINDIPNNEKEWIVRQLGKSWERQIRRVRNKTINVG